MLIAMCVLKPGQASGRASRERGPESVALLGLCRFGVEQRGRLLAKATPAPHVLHMTATPIPRTLALIDHGDMAQVGARGWGGGWQKHNYRS